MIEVLLTIVAAFLFLLLNQLSSLRADSSERLKNIEYRLMELLSSSKYTDELSQEHSLAITNSLASIERATNDIRHVANLFERYRLPLQIERNALDEIAVHDEVMRNIADRE